MTFSYTTMMELGITQSTDTHSKRSLIRTAQVCQRHRAAGGNQEVEGYKHTHTHKWLVYDHGSPADNYISKVNNNDTRTV